MIRIFIFLIGFTPSLFAAYDLAICAIFQNEAAFLKEWIEFHKLQGVEHFYLYNNNSEDDYLAVLKPYIKKKQVTLVQWPYTYQYLDHDGWIAIQSGSYMDCIEKHRDQIKWLAVVDVDEFLFCPSGENLPHFLKNYSPFGGLCVNWQHFGTSDVEEIPQDALMIELLIRCSTPEDPDNFRYKSIVQPKYVQNCNSAHFFQYKDGKIHVDSEKQALPLNIPSSARVLLDKIRINHYWTRSEKYLREVKIPSRQKRRSCMKDHVIENKAKRYNQTTDTSILQFVPSLRKAMKGPKEVVAKLFDVSRIDFLPKK